MHVPQLVRVGIVAAAGMIGLSACGPSPSFAVGDCVRTEKQIVDHDLEAVDCAEAQGSFDPDEQTYKVDEILDHTEGGCPPGRGAFPVEFVHEPDGVTYCLSME